MRGLDMALVSVSEFTKGGAPKISRMQSGHISIMYAPGVHISLSEEEAVGLITGLTALINLVVPEEVAA